MPDPFIGEIQLFSFQFAPRGWAQCNGQLLPINQYQALFSLLGTTYGGDGRTTFALPDLRGRVPVHTGNGFVQGQSGGEESHTLVGAELPTHTHMAMASSAAPSSPSPAQAAWADSGVTGYAASANSPMASNAIAPAGNSQAHENRSPFLTVGFCIALVGIYPSPT